MNGSPVPLVLDRGYAVVDRAWRDCDRVVLSLPMLILAGLSAGLWGAISVASVLAVASLHIWVLGHLPTAEAGLEGHTAVDLQSISSR